MARSKDTRPATRVSKYILKVMAERGINGNQLTRMCNLPSGYTTRYLKKKEFHDTSFNTLYRIWKGLELPFELIPQIIEAEDAQS